MSRRRGVHRRHAVLALATAIVFSSARAFAGDGGIALALTVGTDTSDGACGDQTALSVMTGTQLNYCYVVTNQSGSTTMNFLTAEEDDIGRFKILEPHTLAPGASYQYNRLVTALASSTVATTWTAFADAPGYASAQNNPDVLFADGFDGQGSGAPAYDFIDISSTGTRLDIDPDSNAVAPVSIGFPFTYYGITSDEVGVGINGGLLFGVEAGYLNYTPDVIPSTALGPAILPWWDTFFDSPGAVYAQTIGDAPNRSFVVEWQDNIRFPATPDGVTFELVLHEGTNAVDFQYQDTLFGDPQYDHGLWATVGLNSGADFAVQYSRNSASLEDSEIVRFTPTPAPSWSASAQVSVTVGKPVIGVDPPVLDATVAAGASSSAPLAIGNSGTLPLDWTIAEAPAAASRLIKRAHAAKSAIAQPLGSVVPAYAFDQLPDFPPLVSFDVLHPDVITPIFSGARRIAGADFADNDFDTLYAIDYWQQELLAVQTTDCGCVDQFVHIGWTPPAQDEEWLGMHYDATSGRFYGLSYGGLQRRTSHLLTIDRATGASTVVGAIGGIDDPQFGTQVQAIAVSPEGLIYGVEAVGSNLIAIDRNTAQASIVGPLGFRLAGADMDFDDATGTLYLLAGDGDQQMESTYTVDTNTGLATPIAPVGADGRSNALSAFAIATIGPCTAQDDVAWLGVDLAGGSTEAGASTSVSVSLDAASLAAGTYSADLCIDSNDNAHPRVIVPVHLTVQ